MLGRRINIRPSLLVYHIEALVRIKLVKNIYVKNKRGYSICRISKNGKMALKILEKASKNAKTKLQLKPLLMIRIFSNDVYGG